MINDLFTNFFTLEVVGLVGENNFPTNECDTDCCENIFIPLLELLKISSQGLFF